MDEKFRTYIELDYPLPDKVLGWNMYGAGLENVGRDGKPEFFPMLEPGPDQILVRVDAVGLCFSDVKLINKVDNIPNYTTGISRSNPPGSAMKLPSPLSK